MTNQSNLPTIHPRRDALLQAMTPMSRREGFSGKLKQMHSAAVMMEMDVLSSKIDRYGWDRMDAEIKKRLKKDWLEALIDFPIKEIQRGISDFMTERASKGLSVKAPSEFDVVSAIRKRRKAALASAPKPPEPKKADGKATSTQEERQRLVKSLGLNLVGDKSTSHMEAGSLDVGKEQVNK